MKRTLVTQSTKQVGKEIKLQGWVNTVRDHGKVAFIDLRDRSGIVQVVGGKEIGKLGSEDVVEIVGIVKERPEHMVNPNVDTGSIEIEAKKVVVLNKSKELPLPIDTDGREISEEVRLKYRYLDLRRPRLHENIKDRSRFVQAVREYLFQKDFTEIETPLLTKATKEGSRDFLVPSRLQPGKFFALPQSPQQYKQLLMTAAFERYFQVARCLRDEDPRADRGFEHTQIDMEMSFVNREDVMELTEGMITHAIEKLGGNIAKKPFPIITYKEAMDEFGADRFDMRSKKEKEEGLLSFAWVVDFPFFKKVDTADAAEVRDSKSGWTFTHNPFSQPKEEHLEWHLEGKNIDQILTTQYDLVCNGYEVGGGSIRAHKPEVLEATFKTMGYSDEEINAQVGHMLEAFSYGAPPHGGIAPGVERLLMILKHEEYLREVQAFPQTGRGHTSVMEAPSKVENSQLGELGIKLDDDEEVDDSVVQTPYEKLVSLLEKRNALYTKHKHKSVFTSEEAAEVRGTQLKQGAKALLMYADKSPIMVIVSAATKADFKLLKKQFGIKDLRMATPDEVLKVTGIKIGAVHPVGSLYKVDTYVDKVLGENKTIVFNAGDHSISIDMSYDEFIRIAQPKIGEFSKQP